MYFLYWLHDQQETDILTEGYVGVTKNIYQRLQQHKKKGKQHKILMIGNKQFCSEMEYKLRPERNIGQNISQGGLGHGFGGFTHSDKYKNYLREQWTGTKNPNFGGCSLEAKEKMSKAKSKKWVVVYPDGRVEEITNLRRFSLDHSLDPGCMYHVVNGQRKQHKGFKVGGVSSL
jgi:hypothetical protein